MSTTTASPKEEAEGEGRNKRLRVTRACDFCRRRKVKCIFQERDICYNCRAYNEKCEFTSSVKKRGPQKGYADDLEQRIEQMEKVIQDASNPQKKKQKLVELELKKNKTLIQKRFRPKDPPILSSNKKSPSLGLLSNLFEEYGVLDPRQWPSGIAYDSIHYLGDSSALQFFSHKLNLTKEGKRLKGHTIKKFGDEVVLISDPGVSNVKSSKIPDFQWPKDIHPSGEDIHQYIYTVTGVDRYTTVRLLKIYFSHIHPILPVIDKTEFLKQYRDRIETYPSGELLNAMFGAAARFVECESLEPERKKRLPSDAVWDIPVGWSNKFFDQAEYILQKWSNTHTISNVQAIILILNHRGDRDSKSSASWQMGGFAIRLAHLLGLHRSCDNWDIPRNEKETRKRVWWALYITDRFQTAILGRPINLRDEDIDVPLPDAGADLEEVLDAYEADKEKILNNEIFPRFPSLTAPYNFKKNKNRDRPQIYELFIQFIKLSEILGRILQGLHTPRAKQYSSQHGSDGLVTRLDYELTEWRYDFPNALKRIELPDFQEDVGHFAPVIASMLMFYCSSLILLHQPFIKRTISRSSYTSQQICSSAATRGMRIACRLTARDYLMCPYSFTLYPIMQFGLIHMFNGKNPNPQISSPAKAYLKRGVKLLENVKHMSRTAAKLHRIFTDITRISSLQVAEGDDVERMMAKEECHLEENIYRVFKKHEKDFHERRNMSSIMDAVMLRPGNYLQHTYTKNKRAPPTAAAAATADAMSTSGSSIRSPVTQQKVATAATEQQEATPPTFYDLSNTAFQPPLNMEAEAFSLTQFGYDTTNDTSSLDYILQNINTLSDLFPPAPPAPHLQQQHELQQQQDYASFITPIQQNFASTSSSSFSQQQQQPLPQQPQQQPQVTIDADDALFKSDPNNVFWELPSSMEGLNQWLDSMNATGWKAFDQQQ